MMSISVLYESFNSVLSFQPLLQVLKKMISEGKPGAGRLYQGLINEIENTPGLSEPVIHPEILSKYAGLIETLLSTIFPPSTTSNEGIYAVSVPFQVGTVYSSPGFKKLFLAGTDEITIPDSKTSINVSKASLGLAFNLIQKKFYGIKSPVIATSIHPFRDTDSGLTKYYELNLNAQFVDVKQINPDYELPPEFNSRQPLELEELIELFPLKNFQFEGIMVIDVTDRTHEQVITEIKNSLLDIDAFEDVAVYDELQQHMQSLIGLKNVRIGITPFFKMNDYYLYTEAHYKNSLLFKNEEVITNKDKISELSRSIFKQGNQPILYENGDLSDGNSELLKYYYSQNIESLILCPLKNDKNELVGLMEIAGGKGTLKFEHLARIQPAIQLFALALEKTKESIEMQIDRTIKEHFTAVQPAVEWKFTEASFNYLQLRQVSELAKMPLISFEDVFPLYGAVDVRNSSLERTYAIQQDVLDQLQMVNEVLETAGKIMEFPLLEEMKYKIDKYISTSSEDLLSDDEMMIYEFLQKEVDAVLKNLYQTKPELKKTIDNYFNALDPSRKIIYRQRKKYEDSISRINDMLDRFMDQEQQTAQDIFPHYFERYITDGIEFNIYIGQSITPHMPFNEMYVRNLKLWQLTALAKAARLSANLEKKLPLPLQTTQLILAHSVPLSISFRRKERKFDVDGAYNIRYEIIKKRIDKVHIRDSEERLTQPGKISIVYSNQKDLAEYMEYIEFLQHEKLLEDTVEHHDLEDTQGISGLKAIRVAVNLTSEIPPSKTVFTKKEILVNKDKAEGAK